MEQLYVASCSTRTEAKRLRAVLPDLPDVVFEIHHRVEKDSAIQYEICARARKIYVDEARLTPPDIAGLWRFVEGYRARERFNFSPVKVGRGEWAYRSYTIDDAGHIEKYYFVHDDYDGAPLESGGPPADNRCGEAATLKEAAEAIDELEDC